MFIMSMPVAFQVGDRATVRINGESATLLWRDRDTLVINDTEVHRILMQQQGVDGVGRQIVTFTCSDADGTGGVVIL